MRPGLRFYGLLVLAGLATHAIHEGAHWAAGEALGHDMIMGLNGGTTAEPGSVRDQVLISGAGPAVTIIQALAAFALVRSRRPLAAYAFLYAAAFLRFMATVISLSNPNDEARISTALGLGAWTLPLLVTVGLAALAWAASRRLRLSVGTNALAFAVLAAVLTAIVGLDVLLAR